jgi:hypothetical protein
VAQTDSPLTADGCLRLAFDSYGGIVDVRFSNDDSFASPSLCDAARSDGVHDLHHRVGDFFSSPKTRAVGRHTDRA